MLSVHSGVHAQKCPSSWLNDKGRLYCYSPKQVNGFDADVSGKEWHCWDGAEWGAGEGRPSVVSLCLLCSQSLDSVPFTDPDTVQQPWVEARRNLL